MKKMEFYEPAMCCATGLCGVSVNTELMRIASVLQNLLDNGIEIKRYNLNSAPMAFVENKAVAEEVTKNGIGNLPLTVVDGEIIITKRYPTNEEISTILEIPLELLQKSDNKPVKSAVSLRVFKR